jgi:hypothetical protein
MATVETAEREYIVGTRPLRMSWGAIFGGTVAALGVWLLLSTLGLALGLSSVDPYTPGSARGAGLFTGIWSLVTPLIALFVGGMVAARGSGAIGRGEGVLHGLVMWGLTAIAGAYLLVTLLGSLVSGVASAGKAAVGAASGAVAGMAQGAANNPDQVQGMAKSFGLDADDAVRPINERLRAEGKPTVTAAQLEAATKDVIGDSIRQGELDRDLLVASIADKTALSRKDAEEVAGRVEQQYATMKQQAQTKIEGVKEQVQTGALKAADTTGKVFWGVFGSLALGLVSALLGSLAGVSRRQRTHVAKSSTIVTPSGTAVPPRREVYP